MNEEGMIEGAFMWFGDTRPASQRHVLHIGRTYATPVGSHSFLAPGSLLYDAVLRLRRPRFRWIGKHALRNIVQRTICSFERF